MRFKTKYEALEESDDEEDVIDRENWFRRRKTARGAGHGKAAVERNNTTGMVIVRILFVFS
jgi:hypothetical protein